MKTDKMMHNAAFHQGPYFLLNINQSSGTEMHLNLEIITCNSLICKMDHSKCIVSNDMEESI